MLMGFGGEDHVQPSKTIRVAVVLIETGVVLNVMVIADLTEEAKDPEKHFATLVKFAVAPPAGHLLVPVDPGSPPEIGDRWDGQSFIRPAPPPQPVVPARPGPVRVEPGEELKVF